MGITPKLVVVGVSPVVGGKQEFRLSGMEQLVLEGVSGSEPGR